MSLLQRVFIIVAIAAGSGVSTLGQGHPGISKPLRSNHADNGYRYIESEARRLSAGAYTSVGAPMQSGNNDNQRMLTKEEEHISLQADIADGSNGVEVQRHVTLVIAVPSVRPERREAIRETWSKWADDRVVLRFFTEPPNQEGGDEYAEEAAALLEEESLAYGDVVIQNIGSGMNFGLKLLWAMRWMSYHYSFDFFLRLDDDYFLCLKRLLEDLECLLLPEKRSPPVFAGYKVCKKKHNAAYVDEAYLLFSSLVIDRILAVSNLQCSGFGSYTAAAWVRVGGPGNPEGDVAVVHDYRLDHYGKWWKNVRNAKVDPMCERGLGVHHTYPEDMYKLWVEVSGRTNVTQSTDGCESLFSYKDNGNCPSLSHSTEEYFLQRDIFQSCDSFSAQSSKMWCGHKGC